MPIHRRSLFAFIVTAACLLSPLFPGGGNTAAAVQKPPASSPRRFKVVFRVVRPQWQEQPTMAQADSIPFQVIQNPSRSLQNPDSDTDFLRLVRETNPNFTFDRVWAKKTLVLNADQKWNQPPNFSRNKLWFAIVDTNRELLRALLAAPHEMAYKATYTEQRLKAFRDKGKLVLSYYTEQAYKDGTQMRPHIINDLYTVADVEPTLCLTYMLKVLKTGDTATLAESDVVFVSITELKGGK